MIGGYPTAEQANSVVIRNEHTRELMRCLYLAGTLACVSSAASAEFRWPESYNSYGTLGLIDLPSARASEDAEVAITVARSGPTTRTSFTFQVFPRVSGTFRYSIVEDFSGPGRDLFDRSFDARFTLIDGRNGFPDVAIGLQDFLGTGVFAGEYIVATGTVAPGLEVTGGIGWGRLGSFNGFGNPLGVFSNSLNTRADTLPGGGRFNSGTWFQGDAAFFGGVAWSPNERLTLKAEYSSDAYTEEVARGLTERNTALNFGASYAVTDNVAASLFFTNGTELGFQLTTRFNPKRAPNGSTPEPAPPPVAPRATVEPGGVSDLGAALAREGIALDGLRIDGRRATVRVRNDRYRAVAQAVGRTARVLSRNLPANVTEFDILVTASDLAVTSIVIQRGDLEELEFAPDGAWQIYTRAKISDGFQAARGLPAGRPRFEWSLSPFIDTELFDPDDPLRADLGVRAQGRLALGGGRFLSGSIRKRVVGTLDESTRPSNSVLPRVRSDNAIYNREGDPALEFLVAEQFFRPSENVYGRVSGGYFEKMFGGVSAEVLWRPVASRIGMGVEVNYAQQRDFDQLLGFQDYSIVTGHVSGYFDLGAGYQAQVDAGRYLAGDWGTTLTLEREFANGVSIGAFATFTDVSFDTFGEGSFDKGIRIEIPIAWLTGREARQTFDTTIRPVLRDGGARLIVPNRLNDVVRPVDARSFGRDVGRFWR